jgi:hypothetical protein
MKAPQRYWQLVRLTLQGQRRIDDLPPCRDCIHSHYPDLSDPPSDLTVQRHLLDLMRQEADLWAGPAEGCLRCYISYEIDRTCREIWHRFQSAGLPKLEDMLALVLMDTDPLRQRPTTPPLAMDQTPTGQILRSFNPDKAQLNTWTKRLVISDRYLADYLQSYGIYFDSDWHLLNTLTESRLRQLLTQQGTPAAALQRAIAILHSYQAVYRRDRLVERAQHPQRRRCEPPTADQLGRMVAQLQAPGPDGVIGWADATAAEMLTELTDLAQMVRRSRRPPLVSLDSLGQQDWNHSTDDEIEADMDAFLQHYRQVLIDCLDTAIAQTLDHRIAVLNQRPISPRAAEFLDGLHRSVCGRESMGAIAPTLGLTAQYQVTRLLNLKALRADIRRILQQHLRQRIGQLAQDYVEVETWDNALSATLDRAVETELDRIIGAAERESFHTHDTPRSLLSQRLCHHLTQRRP